jgi:UDP-N-acetylglucosamine 2-epimerase
MSALRRVCVVVNSRANYGRIKTVLRALRDHRVVQLQLLVGASALLHRFGNVRQVIEDDGFTIDGTVYSIVEGENPTTMAKSTGLAIIELATMFENLKPDVVPYGGRPLRNPGYRSGCQLHESAAGSYPGWRSHRLH